MFPSYVSASETVICTFELLPAILKVSTSPVSYAPPTFLSVTDFSIGLSVIPVVLLLIPKSLFIVSGVSLSFTIISSWFGVALVVKNLSASFILSIIITSSTYCLDVTLCLSS